MCRKQGEKGTNLGKTRKKDNFLYRIRGIGNPHISLGKQGKIGYFSIQNQGKRETPKYI
jgi:hypothetical protein